MAAFAAISFCFGDSVNQLFLYTTLGCHLCEQAEAIAVPLCQQAGLALTEVEIADSDTLLERYGVRIPVVRLESTDAELGWPFDTPQLQVYLQQNLKS